MEVILGSDRSVSWRWYRWILSEIDANRFGDRRECWWGYNWIFGTAGLSFENDPHGSPGWYKRILPMSSANHVDGISESFGWNTYEPSHERCITDERNQTASKGEIPISRFVRYGFTMAWCDAVLWTAHHWRSHQSSSQNIGFLVSPYSLSVFHKISTAILCGAMPCCLS